MTTEDYVFGSSKTVYMVVGPSFRAREKGIEALVGGP